MKAFIEMTEEELAAVKIELDQKSDDSEKQKQTGEKELLKSGIIQMWTAL